MYVRLSSILILTFFLQSLAASDCKKSFLAPLVKQTCDFTCGPASLLSWLHYKGETTHTESSLARVLNTNERFGTDYRDFLLGLRKIGWSASFYENLSLEQLQSYLENKRGVIVNIQLEGEGHWALFLGLDASGNPKLMDPWYADQGYRVIARKEFESIWYDYFGEERLFKKRAALVFIK